MTEEKGGKIRRRTRGWIRGAVELPGGSTVKGGGGAALDTKVEGWERGGG